MMTMKGNVISNRWQVVLLSLASPLVFVWLSTVQLDAQRLYYDELHQATSAFAYQGSPDRFFISVLFGDLIRPLPIAADWGVLHR